MEFTIGDGFRDNMFKERSCIDHIDTLPYVPTGVSDLFPWDHKGILLRQTAIELRQGDFNVIPQAPIGSPGASFDLAEREMISADVPHYPQRFTLWAESLRGVRQFKADILATMETERNEILETAHKNNIATWELGKVSAITGNLLDFRKNEAGVVVPVTTMNWFTKFGISQVVYDIDLSDVTTETIKELGAAKELGEEELGSISVTKWILLCGKTFYRDLSYHPTSQKAFERWNDGAFLRDDMRAGWMANSDIMVVSYSRGKIAGIPLIADDEAYLCPVSEDIYKGVFAPATGASTLGKVGEPENVSTKILDHDEGIEFKFQTNGMFYVKRLKAFIRLRNRP